MSAHFSFTKSLYDECNLSKKDQESTGAFKWITDSLYEHKDSCYVTASPFMHNQFRNIPASSIEVENDLRNQTRVLSKCPKARYDPTQSKNCKSCKNCDDGLPCGCKHCKETKEAFKLADCKNNNLVPEYTRINKPCNIFSGISINRFHPLCEDLQDVNKIQSNSYIGTNTRLQVKDAFNKAKEDQPKRSGAVPLFNPQPYKL
jgi:hypothetical protein